MLGFGVCLICVSYTQTFTGTLLLFCVGTAGHGAYHSTVMMNPTDITPQHSGFMFGKIYLPLVSSAVIMCRFLINLRLMLLFYNFSHLVLSG